MYSELVTDSFSSHSILMKQEVPVCKSGTENLSNMFSKMIDRIRAIELFQKTMK